MKEKTLKSYCEPGIRIQFVKLWTPFVVVEYFQVRVNRKRVFTTIIYEEALIRFNKVVSECITQLNLEL